MKLYCVYVVQDIQTGHIKIGHTQRPTKRLQTLRGEYAGDLVYRYVFRLKTRAAQTRLEADLHDLFSPYRIRREWFAASPEAVAWHVMMSEWDDLVLGCLTFEGFGPIERALLRFDD